MRFAIHLLALASLALAAPGQVLYQTDFSDPTGWTLPPYTLPTKKPHWAMDNRPGTAPFGSYRSPPWSLNWNNDVDYNGSAQSISALSPPIDLSAASGVPQLSFWCNNLSEEGDCFTHERVRIRIIDASGTQRAVLCLVWNFFYSGNTVTCPPGWHPHYMTLDRSWGVVEVDFEVKHDGFANDTEGWFFDDLMVFDYPAATVFCQAKVNSQGCTPMISHGGVPSISGSSTFTVDAQLVLNNKSGIFFYGYGGQSSMPFQGGTLCSGPPRKRTPLQQSGGNLGPDDCSGQFSFDLKAWLQSGADPGLVPGVQVAGQYWYRDAASSFGVGLTDAVDWTVLP